MTAQIVPFPSSRLARAIVEGPAPVGGAVPTPAKVLAPAAGPTDVSSNGIGVAALTLVAACRELAASLTILSENCRSADSVMAGIGDGAAAIAEHG